MDFELANHRPKSCRPLHAIAYRYTPLHTIAYDCRVLAKKKGFASVFVRDGSGVARGSKPGSYGLLISCFVGMGFWVKEIEGLNEI